MKPKERRDPKRNLPEGAILWRMGRLLSQGPSDGEQGEPFTYDGVQYGPDGLQNAHWRVDQKGLQYLAETGRLWSNVKDDTKIAGANQLHLKIYRSEMPGRRLTNHWSATIAPSDKRYAVQTGDQAITRCILMTTRPGDLVLDPTGGGGTTAVVAERWGRRWISIDSSRESLAVTRERVLVHDYPCHMLIGSQEGFAEEQERRKAAGQEPLSKQPDGETDPATGFVVDRIPYVSAATLAYANRPDKERKRTITCLVDRTAGRKSGRVCSRFTVETELMEVYQRPEEMVRPSQARRDANWQERIVRMLDDSGVRSDSGQHWNVEGIQSIIDEKTKDRTPGLLSHSATLVDRKTGQKKSAAIAIWPEDAKVDVTAIQRNVRQVQNYPAHKLEVLVVVGAEFAGGADQSTGGQQWFVEVMRVRAGTDVHLAGVTDRRNTSSLVLVAEPSIAVEETEPGLFVCTVHGWNEFNPVTASANWRNRKDIQMWMLDTDFDGTQFCARRIHLPKRLRKQGNHKILDGLLGPDASSEALRATFGWTSMPFARPQTGEIAVRLVTTGGGMMNWCRGISQGSQR